MNNHLKDILIALAKNKIKFVLCGGVAVVLHGVERLTMDIDVAVSMDEENLYSLITVMKSLGMSPRVPVPPETLLSPEKRKIMHEEKNALVYTFIDIQNPYRQVDIFLGRDDLYNNLIEDASIIKLDGYSIPVISIVKLIEMKREVIPPREKDITDIRELLKIMEGIDE
ncbi:MAG TPA: nucleotidyl transferase AbiEii/AbiGii toxin family protein [Spirochaetota bacterium]|nr:nucleotidyl transferase AbiEii/AbiGii toxin family protein [Spirochaetota bacterium]HPR37491.1 nucleotidyl transferase AbiEii/AbiGii toxin family protein [Spirochaetota bacterium]HRX47274.1 nucleotidyl transferase AbiEii/AbiGii toxin family protein [Spirochaetota bacterium]